MTFVLTLPCLLAALGFGMAEVKSPEGTLTVRFAAKEQGLTWSLERKGKTLVETSSLGLDFIGGKWGALQIVEQTTRSSDATWTTTNYRRGQVRDRYNELTVDLEEENTPHRRLSLVFRAYEEGAAFRYVVPEQPSFDGFQLRGEKTAWRFPKGTKGWFTTYKNWKTSQEESFQHLALASVGSDRLIGMPAVIRVGDQSVALAEAALVNWAGLFYRTPSKGQPSDADVLDAALTPLPPSNACAADVAVIRMTPAQSPWRVAICGDSDLDLLNRNDILVNLNPPPEAGQDFSWVKPGASSWDWWVESNNSLSTDLTLKLVDFAAEMGWPYHTIDGGWYGWARRPNHGPDVPVEIRKGFDLKRIIDHAADKGVGIWVWLHWEALEDNGVEETLAKLAGWGVKGVKIDFLDRQDQWMVRWYEKVARIAARHRLMVNYHGAFKPTGTERTWPNNLTREGIRGNEMTKFTALITPEHTATLPFTRFLLGPADFTPGSFGNVFSKDFTPQSKRGHRYGDESDRREIWAEEIGTRAHALALCVAYDSNLMTLCDWPQRYRGERGAEALRNLPTTWKKTTPLAGEIGSHYAVLRETHDGRFYFAALTVKRRNVDLDLSFLEKAEWKMRVFADDPELTPGDAKMLATAERVVRVREGEKIGFTLCDEGGAVAVFERK